MRTSARLTLLVGSAVISGGIALGQTPGRPQAPEMGGPGEAYISIGAAAFVPEFSAGADVGYYSYEGSKWNFGSTQFTLATTFNLPSGAVLDEIQFEVLDQSASDLTAKASVCSGNPAGTACVSLGTAATSGVVPDWQYISIAVGGPTVIDNSNDQYILEVILPADFDHIRFRRALISYHLPVSPAPSVATFNDVPKTHPFFQFIEALHASGITGGCSTAPPLFCPDTPVTRGQLAVFLAKALGL